MIRLTKGVVTVDLRNPDWGDSQEVDLNKITRKTRAGYIRHTRPSAWATIKLFNYTFSRLTEGEKDDLKSFLTTYAAEEITLSRIEAGPVVKWTMDGYIITPVIEIITVREPCSYDASFSFREKIT